MFVLSKKTQTTVLWTQLSIFIDVIQLQNKIKDEKVKLRHKGH